MLLMKTTAMFRIIGAVLLQTSISIVCNHSCGYVWTYRLKFVCGRYGCLGSSNDSATYFEAMPAVGNIVPSTRSEDIQGSLSLSSPRCHSPLLHSSTTLRNWQAKLREASSVASSKFEVSWLCGMTARAAINIVWKPVCSLELTKA
jgi:hypothetical protein